MSMTPVKFKKNMEEIKGISEVDPEKAHDLADKLMCEVLTSLGYGEGVDVFNKMETW